MFAFAYWLKRKAVHRHLPLMGILLLAYWHRASAFDNAAGIAPESYLQETRRTKQAEGVPWNSRYLFPATRRALLQHQVANHSISMEMTTSTLPISSASDASISPGTDPVAIAVYAVSCFFGNVGVAVTGFGMATVYLVFFTVGAVAGLVPADLKLAILIQTLGLAAAIPVLFLTTKVFQHLDRKLFIVFIPATIVFTPAGSILQLYIPTTIVQMAVGILIIASAIWELWRMRGLVIHVLGCGCIHSQELEPSVVNDEHCKGTANAEIGHESPQFVASAPGLALQVDSTISNDRPHQPENSCNESETTGGLIDWLSSGLAALSQTLSTQCPAPLGLQESCVEGFGPGSEEEAQEPAVQKVSSTALTSNCNCSGFVSITIVHPLPDCLSDKGGVADKTLGSNGGTAMASDCQGNSKATVSDKCTDTPGYMASVPWGIALGGLSGFLGGLIGVRGPPLMSYFLHFPYPKAAVRANGLIILVANHGIRVVFYIIAPPPPDYIGGSKGWFTGLDWPLYMAVVVAGALGVPAGNWIHKQLDQQYFKLILALLILVAGIMLLVKPSTN